MTQELPIKDPANSPDFREISIFFADTIITALFAELLESRGVPTKILDKIDEHRENTRIITEPQFFFEIDPLSQSRCLVVGNSAAAPDPKVLMLARPLTETKIESALEALLSR